VSQRWFLDTEFLDDGHTIELISLALINADRSLPEYYAESSEFDWERECVTPWLRQHVEPHLTHMSRDRLTRAEIASDIRRLLLKHGKPEVWGYFVSYDWVVLCQLYGPMVDLPAGFPHRANDLAQLLSWHGIAKSSMLPAPTTHNALDDARWMRDVFERVVRENLPGLLTTTKES